MDTLAETANADYHLSFADYGKQTSNWNSKLFWNGSIIYTYIRIQIYIDIHILYICWRFKRKTEAEAIFLNPFTVCSLCMRKFVICRFFNEETNGSYQFANKLNGLAQIWQNYICIYTCATRPNYNRKSMVSESQV